VGRKRLETTCAYGVHERLKWSLAEGGSVAVRSKKGRELDTPCIWTYLDTEIEKEKSYKSFILITF
jgi:hypothetical protein